MAASPGRWVAGVLSASLLGLFLLPLIALSTYAPFPTILREANDTGVRAAIGFTLFASGLALAVSLAFGVPLGYLIARRPFWGRSAVESLVALPVVVPHL